MRVTLGALVVCMVACAPDFDGTRTTDSQSFGERVITLLCKRIAFQADPTDVRGDHFRAACAGGDTPADAPPALAALLARRPALVKAIDTAVPDGFTGDLQSFLTRDTALALYDDDTISRSIASLADLLDEVSRDDAALAALARVGTRDGYRPAAAAFGIPAALAQARSMSGPGAPAAPSLHGLLTTTVPALTAGGAAHAEWDAVVAALSATLLDVSPPSDAGSPDRTLTLAAQFLLSEQPDLSETAAVPLVRRDPRGLAALAGGTVPGPFVDVDSDRLPDVDALGRFVDDRGRPIATAAPFAIAGDTGIRDPQGRVGTYSYVDLGNTVIGAVGHDVSRLFDPTAGPTGSPALDFVRGASALLGPRAMVAHTFAAGPFSYLGYDTTHSPLLDLLYGWSQLLRDPNLGDLLALGKVLLADHSAAAARLVEAAITTARFGDAHPEAQILPNAPLWDDMMPIVRQILANTMLVHSLFVAFQQPEVKQLGPRFHDLMTYSDRFDVDPSPNNLNKTPPASFTQKPDLTRPDTGFNRSLFQRFLHLLHDSSGVKMCNKEGARVSFSGANFGPFAACDLIQIDNLATFYLDAIAFAKDGSGATVCEDKTGKVAACVPLGAPNPNLVRSRPGATLVFKDPTLANLIATSGDQALEVASLITGFRRHPTPAALNRVLLVGPTLDFLKPTIDPVVDATGALFTVHHPGTLPVLEVNGFYTAVRPIVQAFVDNGAEQVFIDLMSVMFKHWPSKDSTDTQTADPSGANYAFGANARSWEPLVADALAGDLLPALVDNAAELNAITVNGKTLPVIVTSAASFAINPLDGLAEREGQTTTTTADGQPVTQLTPWHVLADAYIARRARLDAAGAEGKAWESAVSGTVDVLFRASNNGSGWAFRNGHVRAVSRAVIDFLQSRIDVHQQRGDFVTWLTQTLPDNARDTLTHPLFAATADLTAKLTVKLTPQDAPPRTAFEALIRDAASETASPAQFAMLRTASADLIQLLFDDGDLVPIAHLAGRLTAPDRPYLATQLNLLQRLAAADQDAALARLAGQLFTGYDPADPGVPAIAAIANGVGEVCRQHPGVDLGAAWTPGDFTSVLGNLAAFLREQKRGFPRFIAIIKDRNP